MMNPWGKSIMSIVQNKQPSHISFKININTLFRGLDAINMYLLALPSRKPSLIRLTYSLKTAHSFTSNQHLEFQVGFNFFSDCHFFSHFFPLLLPPKCSFQGYLLLKFLSPNLINTCQSVSYLFTSPQHCDHSLYSLGSTINIQYLFTS